MIKKREHLKYLRKEPPGKHPVKQPYGNPMPQEYKQVDSAGSCASKNNPQACEKISNPGLNGVEAVYKTQD